MSRENSQTEEENKKDRIHRRINEGQVKLIRTRVRKWHNMTHGDEPYKIKQERITNPKT